MLYSMFGKNYTEITAKASPSLMVPTLPKYKMIPALRVYIHTSTKLTIF